MECNQLALSLFILDALQFLVVGVVCADLVVVGDEQVEDDCGKEADATAAGYDEACDHACHALVKIIAYQTECDLRAEPALDEQYNYEECCRCCKGCLVQRIDEQTKYGEQQVGTGTIVNGVHALATGLLIASISSYAVRSGQRACECRIRSEQGQDYITNTADDVGTVRVELDVLVVASCLETKLLNGYEVAVCDNPCNDCVRQSSDPNAGRSKRRDH